IAERQHSERLPRLGGLSTTGEREVLTGCFAPADCFPFTGADGKGSLMREKTTDETQRSSSSGQSERCRNAIGHSLCSKTKRDAQTLEIVEHRLHRLIPVGSLLCHSVIDDRRQIRWKTGIQLNNGFVWFVKYFRHHVDAALSFERESASRHFV